MSIDVERLQSQVVDLAVDLKKMWCRLDKLEKPTPTPPAPYFATANCRSCESTFKYKRGPSLHRPICPICGKPDDVQIAEPDPLAAAVNAGMVAMQFTPPKDATPDRLNTWWKKAPGGSSIVPDIVGPIVKSRNGRHDDGKGTAILEEGIRLGNWLSVPPRPDAAAGKVFRQCRLPKKGERYWAYNVHDMAEAQSDWTDAEMASDLWRGCRWIEEAILPPRGGGHWCDKCSAFIPRGGHTSATWDGGWYCPTCHTACRWIEEPAPAEQPTAEPGRWQHIAGKCWDFFRPDGYMDYLRVYNSTPADRDKILMAFAPARVSITQAEIMEVERFAVWMNGFANATDSEIAVQARSFASLYAAARGAGR